MLAASPFVVETSDLTRLYGRTVAVDALAMRIQRGEIYGFLGPNGAGKTTTVGLLLGLERPTRGTVTLFGRRVTRRDPGLMRRIGVVPEQPRLYEDMTAHGYLTFFARLYEVADAASRITFLLDALDLGPRAADRLRAYSRGMAQKVSLARALLHRPELLILDEPVANLDPYGIKQVRELVAAENSQGTTVLLLSHVLSEVERSCHRVGIMRGGQLVMEGSMAQLRAQLAGSLRLRVEVDRPTGLPELLRALPFVREVNQEGAALLVTVEGGEDHRGQLSQVIVGAGATILGMESRAASLEDAFLAATAVAVIARDEARTDV